MTDMDKFKNILDELGIKYIQEEWEGGASITLIAEKFDKEGKVDGYFGFQCSFAFTWQEDFKNVDIYEC